MIIASPAKKELAIQLQVLQTPTTTANADTVCFSHEYCSNPDDKDIVTVSKRELGMPVSLIDAPLVANNASKRYSHRLCGNRLCPLEQERG